MAEVKGTEAKAPVSAPVAPTGARFEILKTLFTGQPKQTETGVQINIIGYVLGDMKTKKKKGVTVEEAAGYVAKFGATNANAAVRTNKKKDPKTGQVVQEDSYYLVKAGELDSLRNPKLITPALDQEGKPFCDYSPALQEAVKRTRRAGGGQSKAKVDRAKKNREIVEKLAKAQHINLDEF